jgi:hypothetical protein
MDSTDHGEREPIKNNICSLEWIAWAMEAARRHKEEIEPLDPPPRPETRADAGSQ